MNIPFYDLAASHSELRGAIDAAISAVIDGSNYIMGPQLEEFEAEFAAFCGVRHCIGVSDGLAALTLGLRAIGIGPGDEVIVPAHTFVATWLAVSATGATPRGVDVDPQTFNIDATQIEAAITSRTRCIIPVHLYGRPADMEAISAIAARHGLAVIQDAAQAHGATIGGRPVSDMSTMAAFSFYPTKNLGALGDGGAVVTNDDKLAQRLRMLRSYGATTKYRHEILGTNSRLDELQAAILRVKLGKLPEWNRSRQALAAHYSRLLANCPHVLPPAISAEMESVWHLYVIHVPSGRDLLSKYLKKHGVQTLVHYPCTPHLQTAYAFLGMQRGAFPVAEAIATDVLSLPFWPQMPLQMAETVARFISDWQP